MKHAYYFSHDFNARNDTKTASMQFTYRAQGYGWYWIIVEMLAEDKDHRLPLNDCRMEGMALQCHCRVDRLKEFIKDCIEKYALFASDGEYFWSESLIRRILSYEETLQAKSRAGKKGAEVRWGEKKKGGKAAENSGAIAAHNSAMTGDSSAIAENSKGKKRKVNKKKENKSKGEEKSPGGPSKTSFDPHAFTDAYNAICKNLPKAATTTKNRIDNIGKFLLEFTLEDFKEVCQKANDSPFYTGKNARGWKANFDFLIRPEKAAVVLESQSGDDEEEEGRDPAEKSWEELKRQADGGG